MGQAVLGGVRARAAGGASGRVLELGVGSGRNLPFYGAAVEEVVGVDPSPEMLALAERAAASAVPEVTLLRRSAESLPFGAAAFDTVVVTFALCTIPGPHAALAEARRVLKPGGTLRFAEHGRAPDAGVRVQQERLTPLWKRCAGGCHLDRGIDAIVRGAGFEIADPATGYAARPKALAFVYEGAARATVEGAR